MFTLIVFIIAVILTALSLLFTEMAPRTTGWKHDFCLAGFNACICFAIGTLIVTALAVVTRSV